jgi:hypothetical protein
MIKALRIIAVGSHLVLQRDFHYYETFA